MSVFQSILLPLDGSKAATRSLGCATWLVSRLKAQLHVLSAATKALPARDALTRLGVPTTAWSLVTVHQGLRNPEVEILAAIDRYAIDLIIMTARGETSCNDSAQASKIVGHVTQGIIENSPVPVLLIPPCYEETLPWKTVLVPMSGEPETDASLMLAIQLANALDLKVNIVHVVDSATQEAGATATGRYGDQAHHEYPQRLNELVASACPLYSSEEMACIEGFSLVRGDAAREIFRLAKQRDASLIVAGWHGRFMTGHAQVLKSLCQTVSAPVLLVRPAAKPAFKLRVGEEI